MTQKMALHLDVSKWTTSYNQTDYILYRQMETLHAEFAKYCHVLIVDQATGY